MEGAVSELDGVRGSDGDVVMRQRNIAGECVWKMKSNKQWKVDTELGEALKLSHNITQLLQTLWRYKHAQLCPYKLHTSYTHTPYSKGFY